MKLAIMQPYFFPYVGYWQLINAVDTFVLYDDVNYIKGGWINRNRILLNGQQHMLTLPLEKSSPNKLINEITLIDRHEKLTKTIFMAYRRAPYFSTVMPLLNEILLSPATNLATFLESSILKICHYIGIRTTITSSSKIQKNSLLRSQDKILGICVQLKADQYINAAGGRDLYDATTFKEHGIKLEFIQPRPIEYAQFKNSFIPSLSIIDVLMFNSPQNISEYINHYELITP